MTPFQQRVYDATCRIPRGKVTTYGAIAEMIGVNSAQAIGQALKKNPNAPAVPCHRVIRADGYIGGYMGKEDEKKKQLLKEEGVEFNAEGFLSTSDSWWEQIL